MKTVLRAVCTTLLLAGNIFAASYEYDAISDFESLEGGAAPYYIDDTRKALAINASNNSYREVFARASTVFEGETGQYDVTITALGEIDGECEYRFVVDGVVVGSAVNQPADTDYEVQLHTFQGINIPSGAEIAVESNALTNGLIPEGDSTAFARGRWQTVVLDGPTTDDTKVDLSISAAVSSETPAAGEAYSLVITVTNNSTEYTATTPAIALSIPPNTTLAADGSCTQDSTTVSCPLPALSPGQSTMLELIANTSTTGVVSFTASVSADQSDEDTTDNQVESQVLVSAAVPAAVDLRLSVSSTPEQATTGDRVTYQVIVQNQHPETVATSPVIGVALPIGLSFADSADCTAANQMVSCELPELSPQENDRATFSVTAPVAGDFAVLASVSAYEPETNITDNEDTHTISVADRQPNENSDSQQGENNGITNPDTGNSVDQIDSGGGSFELGYLSLLMLLSFLRLQNIKPVGTSQTCNTQRPADSYR